MRLHIIIFIVFLSSCGILDIGDDPIPGKFVFYTRSQNGESQIYTLKFEQKAFSGKIRENISQITSLDSYSVSSPEWSPDGNEIVFSSTYPHEYPRGSFIYRINSSGENMLSIANDQTKGELFIQGENPIWSPNGEMIAYHRCVDCGLGGNNTEIFVYDLVKQSERQITDSYGEDVYPSWNDESNALIFASSRDYFHENERRWRRDLYKIELHEDFTERLTEFGDAGRPYWNSKQNFLAYWWNIQGLHTYSLELNTSTKSEISTELSLKGIAGWSRHGNYLMIVGRINPTKPLEFHLYQLRNEELSLVQSYKADNNFNDLSSISWYYDE